MIHFCDMWNGQKGFRKLRYLTRFLDFSLFYRIKSWNRLGVNWSHEFMPEKIFTSSHMLAVHLVWHLVWDLCFSKYFQRIHTHGTVQSQSISHHFWELSGESYFRVSAVEVEHPCVPRKALAREERRTDGPSIWKQCLVCCKRLWR